MKKPFDQATLKAMLYYDPETGVFMWLVRSDVRPQVNTCLAGKVAGSVCKLANGRVYLYIGINGRRYGAQRLAWLYMTGEWPKVIVDHHDTDSLNNRWSNLREADNSQNGANAKLYKSSTSGLKGASFCKSKGRFRARVFLGGRSTFLGYYDTAEAAHAAYMLAATAVHGEFARAA
jgi:hypothetical protein